MWHRFVIKKLLKHIYDNFSSPFCCWLSSVCAFFIINPWRFWPCQTKKEGECDSEWVRETHGMREDEKSAITHVYDTLRPKTITRFVNIILFDYYVTHNHHHHHWIDSELINSFTACTFARLPFELSNLLIR